MTRFTRTVAMVAAWALMLGLAVTGGPGTEAEDGDDQFDLPIIKVNCTELPRAEPEEIGISMAFGTAGMEVCDPGVGVAFTVTDAATGEVLGTCVTQLYAAGAPTAGCTVGVPYGTTVVVTEDVSTAPGGYLPRLNPQEVQTPPQPITDGIPPSAGFLNLLQQEPVLEPTEKPAEEPTAATQETPPPSAGGRPAHVHRGTCADLSRQPRYNLTDLTVPSAPHEGAEAATMVEASYSVIAVALDQLLAADHAIDVHASHDKMGTDVACGEIGGPRWADGALIVGLREQHGSGLSGIAYLAPDPADPGRTQVSLFLAAGLAEEQAPPAATPAPG